MKQFSKFVPLDGIPYIAQNAASNTQSQYEIRDEDCFALWDKYAMPDNIRRHSLFVAQIAQTLAELALQKNVRLSIAQVRASALLHDLGKFYSLQYGGSHAQIGASWVVAETRNYQIAQGVIHHVHWPWDVPEDASICQIPLLVLYSDKRVKHDTAVTLEERCKDLQVRYGVNQEARASIKASFVQFRAIEKTLSKFLGWECLDAYSFTCRGLVN